MKNLLFSSFHLVFKNFEQGSSRVESQKKAPDTKASLAELKMEMYSDYKTEFRPEDKQAIEDFAKKAGLEFHEMPKNSGKYALIEPKSPAHQPDRYGRVFGRNRYDILRMPDGRINYGTNSIGFRSLGTPYSTKDLQRALEDVTRDWESNRKGIEKELQEREFIEKNRPIFNAAKRFAKVYGLKYGEAGEFGHFVIIDKTGGYNYCTILPDKKINVYKDDHNTSQVFPNAKQALEFIAKEK